MTWQEFAAALPQLPDNPTREQWADAVDKAELMLGDVVEQDRHLAKRIIGDTLMQTGAFMGYVA